MSLCIVITYDDVCVCINHTFINFYISYIHYRYSRFSTFNQQDSEEVLRCLLDGIRMEEIEVPSCIHITILSVF